MLIVCASLLHQTADLQSDSNAVVRTDIRNRTLQHRRKRNRYRNESGETTQTVKSESVVPTMSCLELEKDQTRRVLIVGEQDLFIDFHTCCEKLASHRCGKVSFVAFDVYDHKIMVVDVRWCSYIIQMVENVGRCIKC